MMVDRVCPDCGGHVTYQSLYEKGFVRSKPYKCRKCLKRFVSMKGIPFVKKQLKKICL